MLVEARRASRNERAQRARGGLEPSGDVYRIMQVAYPGAFLAMIVEGAIRGTPPTAVFVAGVMLFVAAKALKWWAIHALGPCWTFRVIVVPGGGGGCVRPVPTHAASELSRRRRRADRSGADERCARRRSDRHRRFLPADAQADRGREPRARCYTPAQLRRASPFFSARSSTLGADRRLHLPSSCPRRDHDRDVGRLSRPRCGPALRADVAVPAARSG